MAGWRLWLLSALPVCWAAGIKLKVYDASPTPVQVVKDPLSGRWTFNVHLYILADAADPTTVVQGGAFWRWEGCKAWRPAPVALYDEHQVDPVEPNTTVRGYNIAWGDVLPVAPGDGALAEATSCQPTVGLDGRPQRLPLSMDFSVWALDPVTGTTVEAVASKPVELVKLPEEAAEQLEVRLFKAVAFTATPEDGAHVHLVINVWPPQPPEGPHYQLFADVAQDTAATRWISTSAPSRFEHTYDVVAPAAGNGPKTCSRYNLSWRLAPGQLATLLSLRVRAFSHAGQTGSLEFPLPVVRVAAEGATASEESPEVLM